MLDKNILFENCDWNQMWKPLYQEKTHTYTG